MKKRQFKLLFFMMFIMLSAVVMHSEPAEAKTKSKKPVLVHCSKIVINDSLSEAFWRMYGEHGIWDENGYKTYRNSGVINPEYEFVGKSITLGYCPHVKEHYVECGQESAVTTEGSTTKITMYGDYYYAGGESQYWPDGADRAAWFGDYVILFKGASPDCTVTCSSSKKSVVKAELIFDNDESGYRYGHHYDFSDGLGYPFYMVRLAALKTGKSTVKITLKQGGKTYKYKIKVKVQDIDDRGNDCHEWRVDDAMRDYYDYPERLNGYIDSYERLVTAKSEEDLPAGYKLLTGDELKQVQGYLEEDKEERKQYEKLKKKLMGSTEYETVKNINDFLANEYVPPEIVAGGSNKDINFGFLCSYCGIKCMRISWDYYDEITAGTDILESYGHYKVSIDGVWYNIRPGSTPKSAYGIEHGFFLTSDAETPGYDNWENDGLTNSLTTIGYVSATSISYPVFKTFDEARGYIKKDKQFNETTDQSAALIDYCLRCIYDAAENGTDIEADNFKTMRELLKTAVDVFPFNFTQSVDEMEKECFSILLNDKYNFYPAAVEAFSRYYGYGSFAEYFDKYLYECYKNNGDVPYHLKEYFWADCVRGKGYTPVYCTAEFIDEYLAGLYENGTLTINSEVGDYATRYHYSMDHAVEKGYSSIENDETCFERTEDYFWNAYVAQQGYDPRYISKEIVLFVKGLWVSDYRDRKIFSDIVYMGKKCSFAESADKYLFECYSNDVKPYGRWYKTENLEEYFWCTCVEEGYVPVYCTAQFADEYLYEYYNKNGKDWKETVLSHIGLAWFLFRISIPERNFVPTYCTAEFADRLLGSYYIDYESEYGSRWLNYKEFHWSARQDVPFLPDYFWRICVRKKGYTPGYCVPTDKYYPYYDNDDAPETDFHFYETLCNWL